MDGPTEDCDMGRPRIPPGSTLVFKVELLGIESGDSAQQQSPQQQSPQKK